jgi:hypothetical protein
MSSILESAAHDFTSTPNLDTANRYLNECETSSPIRLAELKVHILRRIGATITTLFDEFNGLESQVTPSISLGVAAGIAALNSLITCVHAQQLSHQSQIQLMKQQVAMPGESESGHVGDTVVLKELFSLLVKLASKALVVTSVSVSLAEGVGKELIDAETEGAVKILSSNLTCASAAASAICSSTLSMLLTGFSLIPSCFRRIAPDVVLLCGKLSTTTSYIKSDVTNTKSPSLVISRLSLHCLVLAISVSVRASKLVSSTNSGGGAGEDTGKATPFGSPSYNVERVLDLDVFSRWLISAIDTHFYHLQRLAAYADVEVLTDVQAWEGLVALLPRDGTSYAKPQDALVDQLNNKVSTGLTSVSEGDNSGLCLLVTARMIAYTSLLSMLASGGQHRTRLLRASPALPMCESIIFPIAAVMALAERLLDAGPGLISGIQSLQPALAETAITDGKWKYCLESLVSGIVNAALSLILSISRSAPQVLVHFRTHVSRILLRTLMQLAPHNSSDMSPQEHQRGLFPPSNSDKRDSIFILAIQTSRAWVLCGGLGTLPSPSSFSSPEAYALLLLLSSIAAQGIRYWSSPISLTSSSSSSSMNPSFVLCLRDSIQLAEACILYGWSSLPVGRRFLIEQAALSLFADAWPGGAISATKIGSSSRGQPTSGALKRSREYLLTQQTPQQQQQSPQISSSFASTSSISSMKDSSSVSVALDFGAVSTLASGFSSTFNQSRTSQSRSYLVPPSFAASHFAQSSNGSFADLSTGLALDPETRSVALSLISTCYSTRWRNGASSPFISLFRAVLLSASGPGYSLGSAASVMNAATASQILLQTLPFPLHEVLEAEREAEREAVESDPAAASSFSANKGAFTLSPEPSIIPQTVPVPSMVQAAPVSSPQSLEQQKLPQTKWSPPPSQPSSAIYSSSTSTEVSSKDEVIMAKYATDYANEFPDIN